MSSPKRRKSYLREDGNIIYRARYDTLKKIANTEESIGETSQSNNIHENETQNATFPLLGETEAFDTVTSADEDVRSWHTTNGEHEEFDASQACSSGSNHLENLLQSPGFCDIITTTVQRNPAELLLMALKYSLRNNLPLTSTQNLLRLLNSIFSEPVIPESRYMIDKLFNPKNNTEFHTSCSNCTRYIGKFGALDVSAECQNCQTTVDVSNLSSGSYFAIVDPSDAISEYLEAHEDHYNFVMRERPYERGHLKDVYDGKCYRDFVKNLPQSDKYQYVTATFNTDGAPVFESSTYSIWPIYLMINELPVEDRLKNLIVCGLWFGKSKPEMNVFLDPFVEKINELSSVGIACKIKGETLNVKLYALICCVDTIARSPMNGTMQFNAFYGCDWCLHPGEWFEGCVRYPVLESVCESRDMKNTIKLMKEAVEKGLPISGVKNASPLINLVFFNIILGFVPDYLHCLLAGVAKQITEYLIKGISTHDRNIIDLRLSQIRAPNQLGRLSRPLKDRAMWKAREWENWLLYYSIPVLHSIIDNKLLKHWSLLVESLYTLLKTDIACEELDEADQKLHVFVCGVEQLYSKAAMTYNVHQLLHIAKSVYDWGPLWAHSTFAFESGNHELLTAIQCAKGVDQQILRYVNMQRSVAILEKHLHSYSSNVVNQYCSNLNKPSTEKCLQLSGITYFGNAKIIDKQLLDKFVLSSNAKAFVRTVKDGCLYTSSRKQNLRSWNYFAQLINKTYIQINTFIVDEERDRQIAICNVVETTASDFSSSIQKIRRIDDKVIAVNTTDIDRVCIFLDVTNTKYISAVPNLLKY